MACVMRYARTHMYVYMYVNFFQDASLINMSCFSCGASKKKKMKYLTIMVKLQYKTNYKNGGVTLRAT